MKTAAVLLKSWSRAVTMISQFL